MRHAKTFSIIFKLFNSTLIVYVLYPFLLRPTNIITRTKVVHKNVSRAFAKVARFLKSLKGCVSSKIFNKLAYLRSFSKFGF